MPVRKTGQLPENIDRQVNEIIRAFSEMEEQIARLSQDLRRQFDEIVPHADTHGSEGADPVTPESIGGETPDGAQAKVDEHEGKTSTHGATAAATPNRIMMRAANGTAKVAAPVEDDDIARLDTVKAVTLDSIGAASKTHTHTRSQITDFPPAMPADGGDADTVDGVHAKIIVPSTANLLSATTERYTPDSSTEPTILKRFKLGYPGKCILSFQYYGAGADPYSPKFTAELWMNNEKHSLIGSIQSDVNRYYTYEIEVIIPFPAMEIVIWGETVKREIPPLTYYYQGRVRNAYIKGSLIQIDPSIQVVVD